MSINKQALLEWLQGEVLITVFGNGNLNTIRQTVFSNLVDEIQSGRFDSPSDDLVWSALEVVKIHIQAGRNDLAMIDIDEAISIITEQIGAQRVMESIENIEDEMCDDFSPRAQRINEQLNKLRQIFGINIPDNGGLPTMEDVLIDEPMPITLPEGNENAGVSAE